MSISIELININQITYTYTSMLNNLANLMMDLMQKYLKKYFRVEKDWELLVTYLVLEIKKVSLN